MVEAKAVQKISEGRGLLQKQLAEAVRREDYGLAERLDGKLPEDNMTYDKAFMIIYVFIIPCNYYDCDYYN